MKILSMQAKKHFALLWKAGKKSMLMKNKIKYFVVITFAVVINILIVRCGKETGGKLYIENITGYEVHAVVYSGILSFNEVKNKIGNYSNEDKEENICKINNGDKGTWIIFEDGIITYYWCTEGKDPQIFDFGSKKMERGSPITVTAR